jgi:hypothetical protein
MYEYRDEKGEHMHLLDGKPLIGTSTVVQVLAKPLTWWASGLAVAELGWVKKLDTRKHPTEEEQEKNRIERENASSLWKDKITEMSYEDYQSLLDSAYAAHSKVLKSSANKGTDMHEELESYVKQCIEADEMIVVGDMDFPLPVRIFSSWAVENVKRFIVSEGHCYSERLWTGGIVDCVAELRNGKYAIIDFKSSKEAYISQFIQIAGYDIAIEEHGLYDADGMKMKKDYLTKFADCYIVFPFGAEVVEPFFRYDTGELRKAFESAVVLHKVINLQN